MEWIITLDGRASGKREPHQTHQTHQQQHQNPQQSMTIYMHEFGMSPHGRVPLLTYGLRSCSSLVTWVKDAGAVGLAHVSCQTPLRFHLPTEDDGGMTPEEMEDALMQLSVSDMIEHQVAPFLRESSKLQLPFTVVLGHGYSTPGGATSRLRAWLEDYAADPANRTTLVVSATCAAYARSQAVSKVLSS
jgi:hypothetical protein